MPTAEIGLPSPKIIAAKVMEVLYQ